MRSAMDLPELVVLRNELLELLASLKSIFSSITCCEVYLDNKAQYFESNREKNGFSG